MTNRILETSVLLGIEEEASHLTVVCLVQSLGGQYTLFLYFSAWLLCACDILARHAEDFQSN